MPDGEPTPGADVGRADATQDALDLATAHARDQAERLAAAERLLADERDARRAGLERVLAELGSPPPAHAADVRLLEARAVADARELRRRYDRLRRVRYP